MSNSFVIPWTVAQQAPLSMGFAESGLPFFSPGDLSDPEIESASPMLAGGFFTTEIPRKPKLTLKDIKLNALSTLVLEMTGVTWS